MKRKRRRKYIDYIKANGWETPHKSVNKVFNYLRDERIGSEDSRSAFSYSINALCNYLKRDPDEIVKMKIKELEQEINDFLKTRESRT